MVLSARSSASLDFRGDGNDLPGGLKFVDSRLEALVEMFHVSEDRLVQVPDARLIDQLIEVGGLSTRLISL